jgi:hypothetical protein
VIRAFEVWKQECPHRVRWTIDSRPPMPSGEWTDGNGECCGRINVRVGDEVGVFHVAYQVGDEPGELPTPSAGVGSSGMGVCRGSCARSVFADVASFSCGAVNGRAGNATTCVIRASWSRKASAGFERRVGSRCCWEATVRGLSARRGRRGCADAGMSA